MKKLTLILGLIFLSNLSFSQELDIEKKGQKYFFSHYIDMTEQKKERYISRIMTDNHFVKNLSIKGESVSIIFDKNTSEDEINQTLLYCSRVFNFESYKLIK
jgi:hypothetical protein